MGLFDELKELGVNTDEAIERLNDNVSLYEKLLVKFADMMKKSKIDPDFDCNNYDNIIEVAHSIKGSSGGLSITPIFEAYSEILALLRQQQPEQAKEVLVKVLPIQEDIIHCIEKYS